ncbi:hypothetical protein T492DRAFT_933071 [Pavlovales sp. CCMP2436]|nr:hypothetical protein T492DRAFT_933071 [Pavlovales sp. CCMP2436]
MESVQVEMRPSGALARAGPPVVSHASTMHSCRTMVSAAATDPSDPAQESAPWFWRRLHLVDPPELDEEVVVLLQNSRREQRRGLRQSTLSNRFKGNARLESCYQQYTTQLQRRKAQRRLFMCGAVLLYESLYLLFAPEHKHSSLALKVTHGLIPCALVLSAAASLSAPRAARYWRPVVMLTAVIAFNMVVFTMLQIAADASEPLTVADADEVALYQLAWLFLFEMAIALNTALDFLLVASTCLTLHACYIGLLATQCGWLGADAFLIRGLHVTCARTTISHAAGLATIGGMLLLLGARRINRFERLSFVRSFFLQERLLEEGRKIAGQRIELLGIFSDPKMTRRQTLELGLQPLRLGQELKFLVRAIPRVYLELVPAATFSDARASVLKQKPRIVIFSGHTFAQSGPGVHTLAFEQDNSRMDLQSTPEQFVAMLVEACEQDKGRLSCVFLNACLTLSLALEIMRRLPQLTVIAWSTITEDSAARYFSTGFADAIGEDLSASTSVGIDGAQPHLDAGETLPPVQGTVLMLTAGPAPGLLFAWRLAEDGQELEAEVRMKRKREEEDGRGGEGREGRKKEGGEE